MIHLMLAVVDAGHTYSERYLVLSRLGEGGAPLIQKYVFMKTQSDALPAASAKGVIERHRHDRGKRQPKLNDNVDRMPSQLSFRFFLRSDAVPRS